MQFLSMISSSRSERTRKLFFSFCPSNCPTATHLLQLSSPSFSMTHQNALQIRNHCKLIIGFGFVFNLATAGMRSVGSWHRSAYHFIKLSSIAQHWRKRTFLFFDQNFIQNYYLCSGIENKLHRWKHSENLSMTQLVWLRFTCCHDHALSAPFRFPEGNRTFIDPRWLVSPD